MDRHSSEESHERIRAVVADLPPGSVLSYGEVAARAGLPGRARLVGRVLWEEFFRNRDWPQAAAVAVLLLLVLIPPIRLFQRLEAR